MKKQLLLFLFLSVQLSVFAQDMLKDIYPGTTASNPQFITAFGPGTSVLFFATDATRGTELWKSDGTPSGTVFVKDINPGVAGCSPSTITVINNVAYFAADNGINGRELWKTNGTEAGTVLVKDIWPGVNNGWPFNLKNINGILYFVANNGIHGSELWKSNGTASGTILVKDINPGAEGSNSQNLTNLNGILYFTATTAANGSELWKSNGLASGTVLVKDIWPSSPGGYPNSLTPLNGVLYFTAYTGTYGTELWKTNGTAAGTVMVKDIWPGSSSSHPISLTELNGILYFSAANQTNGKELWKSDGTSVGTVIVKDIRSGSASSNPSGFIKESTGRFFFWADNGTHGRELWISNGTAAYTFLVKDLNPGSAGSNPTGVTVAGREIFFFNNNILWKSGGVDAYAMTSAYSPLPVGPLPYSTELTNVSGLLYYKTNEPSYGMELNTYDSRVDIHSVVTELSKTPQLTLCKGQYVDLRFKLSLATPGEYVNIHITPMAGDSVLPTVVSATPGPYNGTIHEKGYFTSMDAAVVTKLKFTVTNPTTGAVLRVKYVPVNIVFRNIAQQSSLQAALVYNNYVPAISFPHIYLRNNSDSATTLSWQYIQINLGNNITEPMVQEAEFVPPMYYPSTTLKLLKDIKLLPHQTVHLSVGNIFPMDPSKPLSIIEAGWINGQNTTFILIPNSPIVHFRESSISDELLTETPSVVTPNVLSVYPNPAQTSATFQVQLKEDSHVLLRIADMQGNTVTTITNTQMEEGTHAFDWNVPGGQQMYIYQLFVNGALIESGKILTN